MTGTSEGYPVQPSAQHHEGGVTLTGARYQCGEHTYSRSYGTPWADGIRTRTTGMAPAELQCSTVIELQPRLPKRHEGPDCMG